MNDSTSPIPLLAEDLEKLCARLPGWTLKDGCLVKTFEFKTYMAGIEFVNRLAVLAEQRNHHPDLQVGWRRVTVSLSTHSAGAVTLLDVELAEAAEAL